MVPHFSSNGNVLQCAYVDFFKGKIMGNVLCELKKKKKEQDLIDQL